MHRKHQAATENNRVLLTPEMKGVTLDEVIARYQSGDGLKKLGAWAGVSTTTLERWLNEAGIPRRPRQWPPLRPKERVTPEMKGVTLDEVIARFQSGDALKKVARWVGVAPQTVQKWLDEAGIPRREFKGVPQPDHTISPEMKGVTLDEVIARYQSGDGVKRVAKWAGTSPQIVTRWLDEAGIPRRPLGIVPKRKMTPEMKGVAFDEVVARFRRGEGVRRLAKWAGVAPQTMQRWLDEAGMPRHPLGAPKSKKRSGE